MAITKDQLVVQISADTKGANEGIKAVTDKLTGLVDKVSGIGQTLKSAEGAFSAIKIGGAFAAATIAVEKIKAVLEATVGEFHKSEDGVTKLANSLALMGEKDIGGSVKRFEQLADVIQSTTVVADDTVIELAQLGVAAGKTDQQIEQLIKAAVGLSAATGTDVNQAFNQLMNTFKGVSRGLDVMVPELQNLTQAQLLAGDAVGIVASKFDGFGEAMASTYAGQMAQAANATNSLMEELGKVIAGGLDFNEGTKGAIEAIRNFTDFMKENGAEIAGVIASLKTLIADLFNFIMAGAAKTVAAFAGLFSFMTGLTDLVGLTDGVSDKLEKVQLDERKRAEEYWGSIKSVTDEGTKAVERYIKTSEKVAAPTVKVNTKVDRGNQPVVISDEAKAQIVELEKLALKYKQESLAVGKSDYQQIEMKKIADLEGLKIIEKKLKSQRALTDAAKADLEVARRAIAERAAADKAENSRKVLQQTSEKTRGLQGQVDAQNQTALGQAKAARQRELDDIERQRQEFIRQGRISATGKQTPDGEKLNNELKTQESLVNQKQLLGHNDAFNEAKDVGDQIGMSMSKAMDGALTGFMAGASAALGQAQAVIDMAQGLVDAIPKLLFSFAKLLDSITDLPNQLANGVGKVLGSILNLIRNLIPNIIKAVTSILTSVVDFVAGLPDAIVGLLEDIPNLLGDLIDKLPDMFEKLVKTLIEAAPRIAIALVKFLIIKAPEIAMKLASAIAIEIPNAIIMGIIDGLKEIGRMWQNMMKGQFGKGVDLKIDTKNMKKQLAKLTSDTAKIFSVSTIEQAAENAENQVAKINDAAKKAGKTMWVHFLNALNNAGKWLGEAGTKIWNGLKAAAEKIGEWGTAIWDALKSAASTIGDWGTKIWNGFKTAASTIGDWGTKIWNGLKTAAATVGDWGTSIWNGLKDGAASIADFGTNIWNGLKDASNVAQWGTDIWTALNDAASVIGDWGTKLWDALNEAAKVITEWATDLWDALDEAASAIKDWGTDLWDSLNDAASAIKDWGTKLWDALNNASSTISQWGSSIWSGLSGAAANISEWGSRIWSGLSSAGATISDWGGKIWSGLTGAIGDLAKTLGAWGKAIWDGLVNAIGTITEKFGSWGKAIWDGLKNNVGTAFADFGQKIWDGLTSASAKFGSTFTDLGTKIWNGLKSGIDNASNVLSKLFTFDGKGKGTVENFINMDFPWVKFATGGYVPGKAKVPGDSTDNDVIPALLSPGEAVLSRSMLSDPAFRRVVEMKMSGKEIPKFAGGWLGEKAGVVTNAVKEKASDAGDALSGVAQQITEAVIPDWVKDIFDSLGKFVPNIDLAKLAKNPRGEVLAGLGRSITGSLAPFLKKMLQKPVGFADGGLVGSTDSVRAMLTPGEFVINKTAVDNVGVPFLRAINGGAVPTGGSQGNTTYNVTVNIEAKQNIDEGFIRQRLMPVVRDELKRSSLDGRAIVYSSGVRK